MSYLYPRGQARTEFFISALEIDERDRTRCARATRFIVLSPKVPYDVKLSIELKVKSPEPKIIVSPTACLDRPFFLYFSLVLLRG